MGRLLSVALSEELMLELEAVALAQGRTKSELVRDAVRRQLQLARLRDLQQYGRRRAEERGLGPDDVEELVDDVRGAGV